MTERSLQQITNNQKQSTKNNQPTNMKQQFNTLTLAEYLDCIKNHKTFKEFNTLGLYRSLLENEQLTLQEKLEVRDYAHSFFEKTFAFLQVKDPWTYIKVKTLGMELTHADKEALWREVQKNQEQILRDKRIKHRNFGTYSKHNCGHEHCLMNGIMIKQGSPLAEFRMCIGIINKEVQKEKSKRIKAERKNIKNIIDRELDE